mgnify:CR=1 FL=1
MNQVTASKILESMVAFIKQHGMEEVAAINTAANSEFIVQKNAFVAEEKIKISDNYKNMLANEEVRLKIEQSKA